MDELEFGFDIIAILFIAGGVAGFIDALAGGGGLITLPSLLLTGMPPLSALATNKFQGVFGTLTASVTVYKKNIVTKKDVFFIFFASLFGAGLGAVILLYINVEMLEVLIPIVLLSIACYFLFGPKFNDDEDRKPLISRPLYRMVIIPIIGFYDGILGPGTGSFFATAGVALRGQTLIKATAIAKFLNFASNCAALVVFIFSGNIVWLFGAIMIFGQIVGGYFGSLAIVNGGTKFIRPLIIIMSLAMTVKYVFSVWV